MPINTPHDTAPDNKDLLNSLWDAEQLENTSRWQTPQIVLPPTLIILNPDNVDIQQLECLRQTLCIGQENKMIEELTSNKKIQVQQSSQIEKSYFRSCVRHL